MKPCSWWCSSVGCPGTRPREWTSGEHAGKAYDLALKYSVAGLKWDAIAGGYRINAEDGYTPIMVRVVEDNTAVDMNMHASGYDVVYAGAVGWRGRREVRLREGGKEMHDSAMKPNTGINKGAV